MGRALFVSGQSPWTCRRAGEDEFGALGSRFLALEMVAEVEASPEGMPELRPGFRYTKGGKVKGPSGKTPKLHNTKENRDGHVAVCSDICAELLKCYK